MQRVDILVTIMRNIHLYLNSQCTVEILPGLGFDLLNACPRAVDG